MANTEELQRLLDETNQLIGVFIASVRTMKR
jgi:hypothetical protein